MSNAPSEGGTHARCSELPYAEFVSEASRLQIDSFGHQLESAHLTVAELHQRQPWRKRDMSMDCGVN